MMYKGARTHTLAHIRNDFNLFSCPWSVSPPLARMTSRAVYSVSHSSRPALPGGPTSRSTLRKHPSDIVDVAQNCGDEADELKRYPLHEVLSTTQTLRALLHENECDKNTNMPSHKTPYNPAPLGPLHHRHTRQLLQPCHKSAPSREPAPSNSQTYIRPSAPRRSP
jgi:hypothetical protein